MSYNTNCILILCVLFAAQYVCHAKTIKKAEATLLPPLEYVNPWHGKWFPHAPGEPSLDMQRMHFDSNEIYKTDDTWTGKWFPYAPGEPHLIKKEEQVHVPQKSSLIRDPWQGRWFPHAPGESPLQKFETTKVKTPKMAQPFVCDDGVNNLRLDYDPEDIRQNYNYLCIASNRSLFNPNLNTEAMLTKHFLPSAYMPPTKCLNESITYSHEPPTNGAFRPLPAVYGSFKFLPPQRYMRNLAEGAIVMLYHPCAFHGQVAQLKNIVRGCLYRHLITPSQLLTPERPLALLAWRHSLSMSVVDKQLVGQFIRKYAKQGPLAVPNLSRVVEKRKTYRAALLTEARLVTDLDDSEVCGYLEQHM